MEQTLRVYSIEPVFLSSSGSQFIYRAVPLPQDITISVELSKSTNDSQHLIEIYLQAG